MTSPSKMSSSKQTQERRCGGRSGASVYHNPIREPPSPGNRDIYLNSSLGLGVKKKKKKIRRYLFLKKMNKEKGIKARIHQNKKENDD